PDSARALGLRARNVVLPLYRRPPRPCRRLDMSLRSWTRRLFAPAATRPARKAPTRCRPALEALEDRTLLSGTPTSLYLSWGQGPLVYGKSVTFPAWILTPAGPVQPTAADGTVSFYDGAT